MKTVCFFGIYDPGYSRQRVLMRGFRQNGWNVVECRADPRVNRGLSKYLKLVGAYAKLKPRKPDLVIVAFPGQTVVWLARILFGKGIVFDAFVSFYDSNVFDRKLHSARSIRGMRDLFLDWHSVRLASRVLLDTDAHISYFTETFGLPKERFIRVLVGSDDSIFKADAPVRSGGAAVTVEFHGTFIPLQGVEVIVEAARILRDENVRFRLLGSGQTLEGAKKAASGLSNVSFSPKVPYEALSEHIRAADVCLGIFGATGKAQRVIPNKAYECAAMGKAIVTEDSPAIRELFTDGKDIVLCKPADAIDLAAKIRELAHDAPRREAIGKEAASTFLRECMPDAIVRRLLADLGK